MKTTIVCKDEKYSDRTQELAIRTGLPLRANNSEVRFAERTDDADESGAPAKTFTEAPSDAPVKAFAKAPSDDERNPNAAAREPSERTLELYYADEGLTLSGNGMTVRGSFASLLPRVKPGRINSEILVKATRIKNATSPITVVDATAGLGEDSFLLAAAGFNVIMFEKDPVIAALLEDALLRARNDDRTSTIVNRMRFEPTDSVHALSTWPKESSPDVVYLDPMFPARTKSAAVKKKFQVIHEIEDPCKNEDELLEAAIAARPKKIVIKRPVKGATLGSMKPSYSIKGKAIRYDCIVLPS